MFIKSLQVSEATMIPSAFFTPILLLCTAIASLHCVPAIETSIDHVHNVIQKDENDKRPIEENSKLSTLENPLKESKLSAKNIPLIHEKKLTIRHPLPPSWHDILPHEAPRYNKFDQDKVHQEFLLHEGPKLQRRLHHHFTVEELRQRRKELREKLQARYNKLAQITPPTEAVLKMTPPTLLNSTHSVVRKILETTTMPPSTTMVESNDINLKLELNTPTPSTTEFTTPTLIAITTQTETPLVGLAPRIRKILGHVETTTEPLEITSKPNLLTLLRGKHRFSALKKQEPTTLLPDETTLTEKPMYLPKIRPILGSRHNIPTTTGMPTTNIVKDDVVSKQIGPANDDRIPILKKFLQTTEIPEITTLLDEESGGYQDWRQHLKEAIKRRLQKFRRPSEE